MGRRDEETSQPIMRKVTLNSRVMALVPGLCYVRDLWIEIGNTRVEEVPVGQAFHILCDYYAENVGGIKWLTCVTVKGDGIENYEDTGVSFSSTIDHTARLGNLGPNIMPDKDITLTVTVWLHDDFNEYPPYPPKEQWD